LITIATLSANNADHACQKMSLAIQATLDTDNNRS